jgi:hypothetical protein
MVAVTSLVAFNVIPAPLETAVVLGGALLILVPLGGDSRQPSPRTTHHKYQVIWIHCPKRSNWLDAINRVTRYADDDPSNPGAGCILIDPRRGVTIRRCRRSAAGPRA